MVSARGGIRVVLGSKKVNLARLLSHQTKIKIDHLDDIQWRSLWGFVATAGGNQRPGGGRAGRALGRAGAVGGGPHVPIPRVAPWAGMRGAFGSHRTRFLALHPGLVCGEPLGQTERDPQGCTLGWDAGTLWVTRNAAPMAAQPRRRLEGDCGMARSFTRSSPSGATCINPGQRPGIHATHSPQKQQRRPPLRERGAVESGGLP